MTSVKLAVIENNYVTNVIVGILENKEQLAKELGKELVYEPDINLAIGDMRVGDKWTRNVEGVKTVLTPRPTYAELEAELAAIKAAYAEGVNTID